MNIKNFTFLVSFTFSVLLSQTISSENNSTKLTTIPLAEMEIPETIEPPVGGRMGDFHTPELVGSFTRPSNLTAMDVAWDGTYYYVSHGGNSDNVYRFDEQFNQVDFQFVNIDSRGLVQHPVDGKLYMKNYYNEDFYRLNTDPFDGTAEYLFSLSGSSSQDMFTFSADGQYIITHNSGSLKKYDFSTGQLIESLTLNNGFYNNGIANTGNYLLTVGNNNTIAAHDEQGNYIGDIIFPTSVNSPYGTPSYANGLCFTTSGMTWSAWDIDCLLYTSPSPRDGTSSRMPSSA